MDRTICDMGTISLSLPERGELTGWSVPQLRRCLSESKRARAMLDALDVDIVALLEASLTAEGPCVRGIPEVELVTHGGFTRREAGEVVRRAHVIEDAPMVGDALASGSVSSGHVDALARGITIAGDAKNEFLALIPDLVDRASDLTVPQFAAEVTKAAKGVVTDGGLAVFEDQRRSTYLRIWNDASGMVNVRGMFDPETGALLQSRINAQVESMFHSGDRDIPVVCHPWVEANDHRRAHALVSLLRDNSDSSAKGSGPRSDVVVHIDLDTLRRGLSSLSTHRSVYGADLPVETIRRLACDATIIPLVLNGAGVPLDIGRGQRLATASQRRALEAAHTTCAFPGCGVAFHACQIHHIDYWEHGGPTDMTNMVPLCSQHHHAAHEGGWTLHLTPETRHLDAKPPGTSSP